MSELANDIAWDLITTNEIGDGTRDYREVDGAIFMDLYEDDRVDENDVPVPSRTFRVHVHLEQVP